MPKVLRPDAKRALLVVSALGHEPRHLLVAQLHLGVVSIDVLADPPVELVVVVGLDGVPNLQPPHSDFALCLPTTQM
jgi:hypothetical protein